MANSFNLVVDLLVDQVGRLCASEVFCRSSHGTVLKKFTAGAYQVLQRDDVVGPGQFGVAGSDSQQDTFA